MIVWTSQVWTLINKFVFVLVCAKCSKLITLEENIISVQHLPLCLPLFFAFSSKVLNSDIKSCFDEVVFLDAACEECFSIRLLCYCFHEDLIHKIILISQFLPFIYISYPLKVFKSDTGILRKLVFTSHCICFYYKIKTNLGTWISFECNLATMYLQIMF